MLSKHTFLPTKSLFIAAGIAACGLAAVQQSASAISVTLTSPGPSNYEYSVTTDPMEFLLMGDTLSFTGLSGVIGATAPAGFASSFTSDSVTFTAQTVFGNSGGTFTISPFTIESPAALNTVAFSIDSTTGGASDFIDGPFEAVLPPPSAAIPFEFSPGLGLILSGTLFGALKLRSKFGKKEEISF